jgi:hypothetical protein
MTTTLDSYFRSQQVNLQWSPILFAMAHELQAIATPADLRLLFQKIGARFAQSVADQFSDATTLNQLNDSLNKLWSRTQWGFVTMQEASDSIEIAHQFAPLHEAFGQEAASWSIGLLEGFYQNVFKIFSSTDILTAQCVGIENDGLQLNIQLA